VTETKDEGTTSVGVPAVIIGAAVVVVEESEAAGEGGCFESSDEWWDVECGMMGRIDI
jgi:hypothetical protein